MNIFMTNVINNKRQGLPLTKEEIKFFVNGCTDGSIPDYQLSALLMAICIKGMNDEETYNLTMEMAHSGDIMNLSSIQGVTADKHSTGGVGDKTTLVVAPIVAACGVKMAKLSGKGLGHTGGTIDKLASIPGFSTNLPNDKFISNVNQFGLCICQQTGNLTPADKKLYALRDVTATVESIPLIAASVMSKKIASGSHIIVLDVKYGSGAFMKTIEDAEKLAHIMVTIGTMARRIVTAIISSMNEPLGYAVGNSLEVKEAIATLQDNGPYDLTDLSVELAAQILFMAGKGDIQSCEGMAIQSLKDGSAFRSFKDMVKAQGGDVDVVNNISLFEKSKFSVSIKALSDGYLVYRDVSKVGLASCELGAGRRKKDDEINLSSGIVLKKKNGDYVKKGEELAVFFCENESLLEDAEDIFRDSFKLVDDEPSVEPLIVKRIV